VGFSCPARQGITKLLLSDVSAFTLWPGKGEVNAEIQGDRVVLIVDDDQAIREALALALEGDDYPTALAADGADALNWLHRHTPPCLILLDLMMPVMDGWELLDNLHRDARLARIPVVVTTAFNRELGRAARLPLLRKPIELQALLDVVNRQGCARVS